MQIYLARNNQQAGPYSLEQVNAMLARKQVLLTDLAWHQGMDNWKALGELTQGEYLYQPELQQPAENSTELPTPDLNPDPFPVAAAEASTTAQPEKNINNTQQQTSHQRAHFGRRIGAKAIDLLLWFPSMLLLTANIPQDVVTKSQNMQNSMLQNGFNLENMQQASNLLVQAIPQQSWIYFLVYIGIMLFIQSILIGRTGQSIGKRLFKIKIVAQDDFNLTTSFRSFFLRTVPFIFLTLFAFPFSLILDLVPMLGRNRQMLHEIISKTVVVNVKNK